MRGDLNRREAFSLLAGAAVFTTLQLPAAEPGAPLFFTKEEFALLDALTELIIPSDSHSPGARAAGVATYIDRTVAEAFTAEEKSSWQKGLALMNQIAGSAHGASFLKLEKERQIAILNKVARDEMNPKSDAEKFFAQLKQTTAFAYYSSSIGIHQEMNYKGNVILQEFVGYDLT
jgi:hypothetical protein